MKQGRKQEIDPKGFSILYDFFPRLWLPLVSEIVEENNFTYTPAITMFPNPNVALLQNIVLHVFTNFLFITILLITVIIATFTECLLDARHCTKCFK